MGLWTKREIGLMEEGFINMRKRNILLQMERSGTRGFKIQLCSGFCLYLQGEYSV